MKYALLATCLFLAPGLAAAQADEFSPIFDPGIGRVFPLDLAHITGVEAIVDRTVVPLAVDAETMIEGDGLPLYIEDEGVRMPDEQFSLD